jgi:hypothetical protein
VVITESKIVGDVNEYGWHVMKVLEDDEQPGFAYTVGLYRTFRHPEVLIAGLDLNLMHEILNVIGNEIRGGKRFEAGKEYADILENDNCAFRKVSERFYDEYLGFAIWFNYGPDFPALQCVWTDNNGFYPWDQDCDPSLREEQPVLT